MALITRTAKGSKLTIDEMDGNLEYLESNGFVDGEYSQTQEGTGEIIGIEIEVNPLPLEDASIGTYTVSPTGGSGTGAQFELEVIDGGRGALIFDKDTSAILNGGSGYQEGDELTIPSTAIGGITATGTVTFTLLAGSVDVTRISEINVSPTGIDLNTTELKIKGQVGIDGQVDITSGLTATSAEINNIFSDYIASVGMIASNPLGDTNVSFYNLPTSDPQILGQLWVDTANGFVLKVSQGE
jgi:hypothetical protein